MFVPVNTESLIILIPILMLSVISCFMIVERILFYKKHVKREAKDYSELKSFLKRGNSLDAKKYCESANSPLARLTLLAIENSSLPKEDLKDYISGAANLETPKLERFVSPLGTIAAIGPLLGLLGTVTGNIKAFGLLGEGSIQNYQMLAPAIGEALYTTAAGLVVAIPSIIFYNYLIRKVNYNISLLESRIDELVNLIGG